MVNTLVRQFDDQGCRLNCSLYVSELGLYMHMPYAMLCWYVLPDHTIIEVMQNYYFACQILPLYCVHAIFCSLTMYIHD